MTTMNDNNNTEDTKDAVDSTDTPKVDAKALRSAKYAALDSRAYTDQAQQLVDHVFMQVMKADRKRAPSQEAKRQIRMVPASGVMRIAAMPSCSITSMPRS